MEPRVLRHGAIDSTSEEAFRALAAGTARHADVHVASAQTAGRGRRGARWESASDAGLYASFVGLPPPPPPHPAALTMAGGLAVLDAVRACGLTAAELKWPNDVLHAGAKLAGILVETRGLDPARPHYVVGIGINVVQHAFPPELARERPVTSLTLAGVTATPDDVLAALLPPLASRLHRAHTDGEALARDYLAATGLAGRHVTVRLAGAGADTTLEARLLRLGLATGLCLEDDAGTRRYVPLEHVRSLGPSASSTEA